MIRFIQLYSFLFFFSSNVFSQNQNNTWYFGGNAGINFNATTVSALNDAVFSHSEGVSSISDINGNLLFFTNGIDVWNAKREKMPNGFGLAGNNSSSQVLIVPKPGDCNIYYVFTTPSQNLLGESSYSIIDMRLDNGYGDVTVKNSFLAESVTERISATFKNNNIDYWVVLQGLGNNNFYAFSVTSAGVNTIPVTSFTGLINSIVDDAVGCMKFSSDGKKLATANELGIKKCQLFDFDNQTGVVSNGFVISDTEAYGVEFSDDDSKLYFSRYSKFRLTQYDLSSNNNITIKNSEIVLADLNTTAEYGGSLQLGPNKKIYIARNNKTYIDVINNPNQVGINCGYLNNAVSLNGKPCFAGLPNFLKNYPGIACGYLRASYTQSSLCGGNNNTITVEATYGNAPYLYSLDGINFQTSNIFTNRPASNYEITVRDASAIIRKTIVNIPVINSMIVTSGSVTLPDCGFSNGSIEVITTNGVAPFQYSKDGINFQASNVFTNLAAANINFTVKDNNGCIANKLIPLPAKTNLKVFAGRDTGIFINQTLQLFAKDLTNSSFIGFKWIPSEGLNNPLFQNPIATITRNIDYIVEATSASGCVVTDTIHIDVYKKIEIFVPTAFTPNADGRNDILKVIPRGIKRLNYFKIFDRYGNLVFTSTNFNQGWDGSIKGKEQNTGSFVWLVEGVDINNQIVYNKGFVTLIR